MRDKPNLAARISKAIAALRDADAIRFETEFGHYGIRPPLEPASKDGAAAMQAMFELGRIAGSHPERVRTFAHESFVVQVLPPGEITAPARNPAARKSSRPANHSERPIPTNVAACIVSGRARPRPRYGMGNSVRPPLPDIELPPELMPPAPADDDERSFVLESDGDATDAEMREAADQFDEAFPETSDEERARLEFEDQSDPAPARPAKPARRKLTGPVYLFPKRNPPTE